MGELNEIKLGTAEAPCSNTEKPIFLLFCVFFYIYMLDVIQLCRVPHSFVAFAIFYIVYFVSKYCQCFFMLIFSLAKVSVKCRPGGVH